ncbi:hypothetical protein MIMGU_mgv11b023116mg [Erythranthe guttata]|uniref:GDSL esterase/lipase n=1 Tax=Erythranthe guttata TaxID=4155 RepID=A0A022Q432_ERYGU|nr:hypothetical protein MIMGU_mgv11b023116mg [Erythranthe guttata]
MCLVAVLLGLITPSLGELKYCPAPDIARAGSCGADGTQDCFLTVLGRYPAKSSRLYGIFSILSPFYQILPFKIPCPDGNQYIFWDAFHPTEAVNVLFGRMAFNGNKNGVYPFNVQELVSL